MKKFRVLVNGSEYNVEIEELTEDTALPRPAARTTTTASNTAKPAQPVVAKPTQTERAPAGSTGGAIVAPMPGTILSVAVEVGVSVTKGQTLLVLEAMKMENEIQAPTDGTVQTLNVSQGLSVNAGDTLVVLS